MNRKVIAVVMALGSAGCSTLAPQFQLLDVEDFPPPVIAGVTRFRQNVPPDPPYPDTAVPPTNIWGVTKFAQVGPDLGVPDSGVPQPVFWVRFGVTREMAAREAAVAGNPPTPAQGKAN
jgi:hypothetical protein